MDERTRRSAVAERGAPMLRGLLARRGGFTLAPATGALLAVGIAVGAEPAAALSFPLDAWDDARVDGWLAVHLPVAMASGLYVGGWLEWTHRRVSFDLVRVFDPHHRHRALTFGRVAGQRAVYDLARRELLHLVDVGVR